MGSKVKPVVYYENWILKKEGVKTWVSYWAVIRGRWLQFYGDSGGDKQELRKTLELTKNVKCSLIKRNKRRFPFAINNGLGTYYIKCETELERYHWIFSVLTASLGRSKTELPAKVPIDMAEIIAFEKFKTTKSSTKNPSPTKVPTAAANITNKRRQKYAIRSENRQKRKAKKRAKKLGLYTENTGQKLGLYTENTGPKTMSSAELRRTKHIRFDDHHTVRHFNSLETLSPRMEKITDITDATQKNHSIVKRPSSATSVQAIVHSTSKTSIMGDRNFAFDEEEDVEAFECLNVKFDNKQPLPDMIITEVSESESDDDDDESLNTAETSMNSCTSSFLSSSGASHTRLSSLDDDLNKQRGTDERLVPSIGASPNDNLTVSPKASGRLTPKRPLTPNSRQSAQKSPAQFSRFMMNDATFSNA